MHRIVKKGADDEPRGVAVESVSSECVGRCDDLFRERIVGKTGNRSGDWGECGDAFDIRNPWISGACGTLRDFFFTFFVRISQK